MIVAKYKFDSSIYSNLIPIFNDGYNGYTITDEIDSENSNHIIRTIECDVLPTLMRFGRAWVSGETATDSRTDSLLEILDINTSGLTSCNSMFRFNTNLTSISCEWDTSNVTNMYAMFAFCSKLTSLDVSNFDTSKVTTMAYMFRNCSKLTSLDVSDWDTSKVTNMEYMLYGCNNLTSLDVSNFDTSKVTSMYYMFYGCNNLTSLDVSNFDTSKVTSMSYMFYNCEKVQVLDVSNWDTSNVIYMNAMFWNCLSLTSLNLSNFDTSNVTNLSSMIGNCTNLTELNINNVSINSTNIKNDRLLQDNNNLSKLYCNDTITLSYLMNTLCDRTSATQGELVTTLELDDEIATNLTAKNWIVKKLVAQYKYDANTYENLIPEFNIEFSSDKYEVNDSISEIVIDNIKWEDGKWINQENGSIYSYSDNSVRTSNFLNILENVEYKTNQRASMFWYNENKTYIGYIKWVDENTRFIAPVNAKYVRIAQSKQNEEMSITAKLITRSIESVNGDLPTLMRFGYNGDDTENHKYDGQGMSLLKIYDMNTKELTTAYRMFKYCKRVESIKANWDTSNVTTMCTMFFHCYNLTSLDVSNWDTSEVTDMRSMFNNCTNLTSLDVSNFDTNKVEDMGYMFRNCTNLTSLDVSNFDTSNVTNMRSMFSECENLTSLDVSNFNTSNVTDMYYMFRNCTNLTSLDVSNFDTSNVTNMGYMFYNCKLLTSLDVSKWNTSNVTRMDYMFNNCNNLISLDVSNFITSKVTNMNSMFNSCKNLTSLDVSNFDTSRVTDIQNMFYGCTNLASLDVSRWDTSNVTNMGSMFWKCKNINYLNLNNWNFDKVVNMICIFSTNVGMKMSLETLDIANWEISDSINTSNLFYIDNESLTSIKNIRCNNANVINNVLLPNLPTRSSDNKGQIITSAELTQDIIDTLTSKNWTVVSSDTLTKVAEYVYDSKIWNSMIPEFNNEFVEYFIDDVEDENGLVTRTISSMGGLPTSMIFGVKYPNPTSFKEKSLYNVNYIDTSNLINTPEMFRYCINLISINTANWDTSKIASMGNMFFNCSNLTSLDVSNFDTGEVINMSYMFCNCQKLTSLDLSNFDTSNAKYMQYMFSYCNNLTSLDVSNFNTKNVTNMDYIFNNTPKLSDIGMLYCTPSTINTIASNLPTTHTQTIWVKDIKPSECTVVSGVEFKEYKENSVMINLSSPLLDGDRIEVKDGKLCHYHKMGMIVLDGSEDWVYLKSSKFHYIRLNDINIYIPQKNYIDSILCDSLRGRQITGSNDNCGIYIVGNEASGNAQQIRIRLTLNDTLESIKQWLQEKPTTVVYELAEPYYEDITPIQSKLTLETYLESNLDIYTDLPIKTNLTYLTNITNTSSIEEDIASINEGTDLTNLLEDEINN